MTEITHMRPPMHNTLVLRNHREYRNKYSATESVGVSATMHFYVMHRFRDIASEWSKIATFFYHSLV